MKTSHLSILVIAAGLCIIFAAAWQHQERQQSAMLNELRQINKARRMLEAEAEGRRAAQVEIDRINFVHDLERDRRKARNDAARQEDELRTKMADAWKWADGPTLRAKAQADLEAARASSEASLGFPSGK